MHKNILFIYIFKNHQENLYEINSKIQYLINLYMYDVFIMNNEINSKSIIDIFCKNMIKEMDLITMFVTNFIRNS